jgi:creatinine amidohydrolase
VTFDQLTWTEVRALAGPRAIALVPIGALEAHGPHLPLSTDVIIAVEMAERAAKKLGALGFTALVMPPVHYTQAGFAQGFAGTMNADAPALRGIADSIRRSGIPHVCLANSHLDPDHVETLRRASEALGLIFPDMTRRRWAETLTDEFRRASCHAGRFETSLVLAARPNLVKPDFRRLPAVEADLRSGCRSFEEAGMPQAYCGAPAEAIAEEGERTFDLLADMIVTTVKEKLNEIQG